VSVRIPAFRRRRARQISTAARAVAQRTPETLILVRRWARPTAVTVARLAGTAVFAYLVALPLPVTPRPVLAPLTALLVAQVSLYQTLRSAVQRVAAVVAGVLLAVGLSALVGFTWWSLGITIVVAVFIGYALRLGDAILEVPISAMLILSVTAAKTAATGRIIETLIGAAAGLAAGFVLARRGCSRPPRPSWISAAPWPTCWTRWPPACATGRCRSTSMTGSARARAGRRDRAGGRRAPRGGGQHPAQPPRRAPAGRPRQPPRQAGDAGTRGDHGPHVRPRPADSIRLAEGNNPLEDPEVRDRLAGTLTELAVAIRIYGGLAAASGPSTQEQLRASWSATWPRPRISRTGSASCSEPTRRPGRSAGRSGVS
jgi:hypothetical protein